MQKRTSRAIVQLDHQGKLVRTFTSIPIAACLLDIRESDLRQAVRSVSIIHNSVFMFERDYNRVCEDDGTVPSVAWETEIKKPIAKSSPQPEEPQRPKHRRRCFHTGTIYSELHNRGRRKNNDSGLSVSQKLVKGVGMVAQYKYRWVAEITVNRVRYRKRSAHFHVVRNWLDEMVARYAD